MFNILVNILNKLYLYHKQIHMSLYQIHVKQKLPISLEEAWAFFSDPMNLNKITPDNMGFVTHSGAYRAMYPGQIIEYTVTPLWGIQMNWVTEITHVVDRHYFVDEQRFGPYALWHHKHFLKAIPGGVEMEDIVHYRLPLGILGRLFHPIIVKPRLDEIFAYRYQKLIELFGPFNPQQT